MKPTVKAGDRIKFRGMKRPFPVIASNKHFTICAYKLTGCLAEKLFVYTIIDWENQRRGPDAMIFGPNFNYLDPVEANKALKQLGDGRMHKRLCKKRGKYYRKMVWESPELETSRRRSIPLDIEMIIKPKKQ